MSETTENKKTAIILFNLGGPDNLEAVRPFLFNLFFDQKIVNLPVVFRYFVALFIAFNRKKKAEEIYKKIGGKSSIIEETKQQISALQKRLKAKISTDFKIFMSMRHWHPMSNEVISKIKEYSPNELILIPLYPQFSTTTTGSSIEDFKTNLENNLADITCKTICCYPNDEKFIKSHVEIIKNSINQIKNKDNYRILFSAHGLPKKIIDSGDPYQWQVEKTVDLVVKLLQHKNLDYKITYQSKVGPLEWIKPNTEDEIKLAIQQKKELIIVPIAFVSEHVETLVELDIEYKLMADRAAINYIRVPALGIDNLFIESLSDIIIKSMKKDESFILSGNMSRICPNSYKQCLCNA